MSKQRCVLHMDSPTIFFLKLGFAAICLQLSLLYINFDILYQTFRSYAYIHYAPALEYVAMSVTLVIGGALLIDYIWKTQKENGGDD